jgi:hypothetical protein
MIEKKVRKARMSDFSEIKENLAFWLSKAPEERIEAVERLRRERHGNTERLQRIARVVQRYDLGDEVSGKK